VHPQHTKCTSGRARVKFLGHFLLCWEDLKLQLVVLDCLLKETTKKIVNYLRKKVHPRQNPGYAYDGNYDSFYLLKYHAALSR